MSKTTILSLLAKQNYITYNKQLAKIIGIDEAILYGELCSISCYNDEEEFAYEQEKLIDDTCLSEYRIRNALKKLIEFKLVEVNKKGLPSRYYYKLNDDSFKKIMQISDESLTTSPIKFDTTGDSNFDTTSIIINNNKDIKKKKNKEKNIYSSLNNVKLTQNEYDNLKIKFPNDYEDKIENLAYYIASKGDKYQNHYMTILNWERKKEKDQKTKPQKPSYELPTFN